jgi:hypothetical protein
MQLLPFSQQLSHLASCHCQRCFRLREITGYLAQNFCRLLQGQADGLVIKRDLQLRLTGKNRILIRLTSFMFRRIRGVIGFRSVAHRFHRERPIRAMSLWGANRDLPDIPVDKLTY